MMKKEIPENMVGYIEKMINDFNNIKNVIENINIGIEDLIKNNVILPNELFEELYNDSLKLAALEAAGVDNWDGYSYSQDLLKEMKEEDEEEEEYEEWF
jgi:hypothetical protein